MDTKIKYHLLGIIIVGTIGAVFGFIIFGSKGAIVGAFIGTVVGEIFGIALSAKNNE